jgi:hypothetical protein
MDFNNRSTIKHSGISATNKPARNLRGIYVHVKNGATVVNVRFPRKELDNSYSIVVQPNWFSLDKVVEKSSEGFSVEFSTPAPKNAGFDWQMIR